MIPIGEKNNPNIIPSGFTINNFIEIFDNNLNLIINSIIISIFLSILSIVIFLTYFQSKTAVLLL